MDETKYVRIARDLEERIKAGEYRPGARLPSTSQIMRDHEVSSTTARLAMAILVSRGYASTRPRSGTYVNGRKAD